MKKEEVAALPKAPLHPLGAEREEVEVGAVGAWRFPWRGVAKLGLEPRPGNGW